MKINWAFKVPTKYLNWNFLNKFFPLSITSTNKFQINQTIEHELNSHNHNLFS
jgi:hypothetical protein